MSQSTTGLPRKVLFLKREAISAEIGPKNNRKSFCRISAQKATEIPFRSPTTDNLGPSQFASYEV